MPPQKRLTDPCAIEGHKVESLKVGAQFIPTGKRPPAEEHVLIENVWVGCIRCGRSLEQVKKQGERLAKNDEENHAAS